MSAIVTPRLPAPETGRSPHLLRAMVALLPVAPFPAAVAPSVRVTSREKSGAPPPIVAGLRRRRSADGRAGNRSIGGGHSPPARREGGRGRVSVRRPRRRGRRRRLPRRSRGGRGSGPAKVDGK